ncbi:MAG: segregation/condensation protein A [Candidatus Magasanikbacteria bacterium]|nr:segregation/condensation protein A [Candidatus Magasanikbacteria bacterium]
MTAELKLEKFQGPLELLLELIEEEKLNITEVALGQVTEQYFKHLDTLGGERSELLADFLVIATKLVYLKSKQLLPYLYPEEDEGPSLADQLKLYKRYADASKLVENLWNEGNVSYGRVEPPPARSPEMVVPVNAHPHDLHASFVFLLKRLKPIAPLPEVRIDHTFSVKQKVESIFNFLKQWTHLSFKKLLGQSENKTEVIVSFLALLELVKQEKITIKQSDAFGDMEIRRV